MSWATAIITDYLLQRNTRRHHDGLCTTMSMVQHHLRCLGKGYLLRETNSAYSRTGFNRMFVMTAEDVHIVLKHVTTILWIRTSTTNVVKKCTRGHQLLRRPRQVIVNDGKQELGRNPDCYRCRGAEHDTSLCAIEFTNPAKARTGSYKAMNYPRVFGLPGTCYAAFYESVCQKTPRMRHRSATPRQIRKQGRERTTTRNGQAQNVQNV